MRDYRERLRAPVAWWLIGGICVIVLGTELFAGFSLAVGVAVYIVLGLICAVTLAHWGGPVVSVRGGELRVDPARLPLAGVRDALLARLPGRPARPASRAAALPLAAVGEVRPLDEAQTRAMRGPHADPRAYMLIRPYLRESVYVGVSAAGAGWPYLLIGTRQPARLADAIERSRAAMASRD